jgi:pimeloyl-ACP methyl ester carboxylesterase
MTGTPVGIIESIKRSPGWARRQALAHTLSQDLRLANGGRVPIERTKRIEVPVLVLAGAVSPSWAAATTATLVRTLPHASEHIVAGQQHLPADSMLAAILGRFFRSRVCQPATISANAA